MTGKIGDIFLWVGEKAHRPVNTTVHLVQLAANLYEGQKEVPLDYGWYTSMANTDNIFPLSTATKRKLK